MLVQDYRIETIPRSSGTLGSYNAKKIYLNDQFLSNNLPFPDHAKHDDALLLQLEVCPECATAGCATGNYVQVLILRDYIIWKEPSPLLFKEDWEEENYAGMQDAENYIWPRQLYIDFCRELREDISELLRTPRFEPRDAAEMWATYVTEGSGMDDERIAISGYDVNLSEYPGEEPAEFIRDRLLSGAPAEIVPFSPIARAGECVRAFNRGWEKTEKEILRASPEAYYFPIDAEVYLRLAR